jgi:glutathione S-transferase
MMINGDVFLPPTYVPAPFVAFLNIYGQGSPPVQLTAPSLTYNSLYQENTHQPSIKGSNSDNSISFKLYDFDSNNQTEIIRLIFYFAGIPFKDKLVKQEEWDRVKDRIPVQQLPILRVNNQFKIYYLNAIVRYLAREFHLYGTENLDQTIVDIVFESNRIFQEKLFEQLKTSTSTEQRKTILTQFLTDHTINHLDQLENFYEIFNRQGPFYLGSQISLADLIVYQTISYFIDIDPKLLDNYPHLQDARRHLEKQPQLANYLNRKNRKIKRRRHATVPPTSHHDHHRHRQRSYDVHKPSDRHRSGESTPSLSTRVLEEKELRSFLPIKLPEENEVTFSLPTRLPEEKESIETKQESKSPVPPEEKESIHSDSTEIRTSVIEEDKSEHIDD